jgi:hypothetical protein
MLLCLGGCASMHMPSVDFWLDCTVAGCDAGHGTTGVEAGRRALRKNNCATQHKAKELMPWQ